MVGATVVVQKMLTLRDCLDADMFKASGGGKGSWKFIAEHIGGHGTKGKDLRVETDPSNG